MSVLRNLLGAPACEKQGDFYLNDPRACNDAIRNDLSKCSGCDRIVLNIHADSVVEIFSMDQWEARLPKAERRRRQDEHYKLCDYIICDKDDPYARSHIAFCDLSCVSDKYLLSGDSNEWPEGKRSYVLSQMVDTARYFLELDVVAQTIMTATDRSLIFGFRSPEVEVPKDETESAMLAFMRTSASESDILVSRQDVEGIKFTMFEVKYPARLQWETEK